MSENIGQRRLINDVTLNSYIIYNMKHPNKFYLLDYKIDVAKHLIQYHRDWKIPMLRPT